MNAVRCKLITDTLLFLKQMLDSSDIDFSDIGSEYDSVVSLAQSYDSMDDLPSSQIYNLDGLVTSQERIPLFVAPKPRNSEHTSRLH
jgi:hypothetical protein